MGSICILSLKNYYLSWADNKKYNECFHSFPNQIGKLPLENQIAKTLGFASRVRGCLFGGATGDAMGYRVEFKGLGSIRSSYGDGGIQEPEETDGYFVVSDDTQMTLFTLEGLIRGLGKSDETILEEIRLAYVDWLATREAPDIGWQPRGEIYHNKELRSYLSLPIVLKVRITG